MKFKNDMLKKFVKQARDTINLFEAYIIHTFLPANPLFEFFCRYNNFNSDLIPDILEFDLDEV
jgi:hypothetical protein